MNGLRAAQAVGARTARAARRPSARLIADAVRGPAPVVALHDAEGQRADAEGDQRRAPGHRAADAWPGTPAASTSRSASASSADRHVDQKDPAPARGHQHAADQRARAPRRSRRSRSRSAPRRRAVRAGTRRAAGRAMSASSARRRRPGRRGTRPASRRCSRRRRRRKPAVNSATPSRKLDIAAVALGEPAEEHQQRRIGDRIAVQDPGQVFQIACREILRDVGQRRR